MISFGSFNASESKATATLGRSIDSESFLVFCEQQDQARVGTRPLLLIYVLAILTIVVFVYCGISWFLVNSGDQLPGSFWNLDRFLLISMTSSSLILIPAAYKVFTLRAGGRAIAGGLGGRLMRREEANEYERQCLNVVEELAIAAALPVPPVYVLADSSINAFAVGLTSRDAVVGLTRGCIEKLTRDQLEGVVGHELSHIRNGDTRLNLRLIGLLFGLTCLSVIGAMFVLSAADAVRRSRGRKGEPNGLVLGLGVAGVVLCIAGGVGVGLSHVLKAAISRQREFLADASSIQLTGNPEGLRTALLRIMGDAPGATVAHGALQGMSHMFFVKPVRSWAEALLESHPSLEARIRRIEVESEMILARGSGKSV